MEYKIEDGKVEISNEKYWIFSGELNNYSLDQLNTVINEIQDVIGGKYEFSSFCGDVVFTVEYNKSSAKIEYYNDSIGEEDTMDILTMLEDLRKEKLREDRS